MLLPPPVFAIHLYVIEERDCLDHQFPRRGPSSVRRRSLVRLLRVSLSRTSNQVGARSQEWGEGNAETGGQGDDFPLSPSPHPRVPSSLPACITTRNE